MLLKLGFLYIMDFPFKIMAIRSASYSLVLSYYTHACLGKERNNIDICLFLLLYVPCQQLWSLRDGQFT